MSVTMLRMIKLEKRLKYKEKKILTEYYTASEKVVSQICSIKHLKSLYIAIIINVQRNTRKLNWNGLVLQVGCFHEKFQSNIRNSEEIIKNELAFSICMWFFFVRVPTDSDIAIASIRWQPKQH